MRKKNILQKVCFSIIFWKRLCELVPLIGAERQSTCNIHLLVINWIIDLISNMKHDFLFFLNQIILTTIFHSMYSWNVYQRNGKQGPISISYRAYVYFSCDFLYSVYVCLNQMYTSIAISYFLNKSIEFEGNIFRKHLQNETVINEFRHMFE